mmetsp:Transcript_54257/g.109121  ORF Transcript_54257/g.109121 Transcript_54257/m.109121 type:complete len:297 (+) Transcript_54257:65-955(+)
MVSRFIWSMLLLVTTVKAADPDKPHAHRGRAAPFKPGAPDVKLSAIDLAQLSSGQTVKRQVVDVEAGTAMVLAVQDVAAPVDVILERITAFPDYPQMVQGVVKCANYKVVTHPNKTMTIKTHLELKAAIMTFGGYFVHSYYPPPLSSLTWTLDYDRTSDYVDSVGYWHVMKLSDVHSRVFYSVNLMPADWVPSWIVDILQKQALGQATAWVKLESEKRAPQPPSHHNMGVSNRKRWGAGGQKRDMGSFWCVWWSLYGDLLHDSAKPGGCELLPDEPENTAIADSDAGWFSWMSYLI